MPETSCHVIAVVLPDWPSASCDDRDEPHRPSQMVADAQPTEEGDTEAVVRPEVRCDSGVGDKAGDAVLDGILGPPTDPPVALPLARPEHDADLFVIETEVARARPAVSRRPCLVSGAQHGLVSIGERWCLGLDQRLGRVAVPVPGPGVREGAKVVCIRRCRLVLGTWSSDEDSRIISGVERDTPDNNSLVLR